MPTKKKPIFSWLFTTISGRRIRLGSEPPRWSTRAGRHQNLDVAALRKRRTKNKVATRSRRINRQARNR